MVNSNYCAPPTSTKEIIQLASFFRKVLGISADEKIDVIRILEFKMQEIFEGFNYVIVDSQELPDTYAYTDSKKKEIVIRDDIYDAAINGDARHRFTIAHEIAHYIKHLNLDIKLARSKDINKVPIYETTEWQANTFARHFLVPIDYISNLREHEIAEKYGVSLEVARYQIDYLNKRK
ncbi:MAG: ImmA/IrrE family metallo-endopeptidase [Erysipelotrichaceae bacterium]|nr:ImmA/IrrE family metallo-endopeptidase [Erysipelotrichaceae bacterium]